jgi:hypothetical protein
LTERAPPLRASPPRFSLSNDNWLNELREKDLMINQLIEMRHQLDLTIAQQQDELKDLKVLMEHKDAMIAQKDNYIAELNSQFEKDRNDKDSFANQIYSM